MRVETILAAKPKGGVISLGPDASLTEAAALLSEKRIGTIVITRNGTETIGILSERDIVRELGRRGPSCMTDLVRDVMTLDPVTCAPDDDAVSILERMTNGRFRHMPVVHKGELIGLISIGDVVKARLSELQTERDAMEGMIAGY